MSSLVLTTEECRDPKVATRTDRGIKPLLHQTKSKPFDELRVRDRSTGLTVCDKLRTSDPLRMKDAF